MGSYSSPKLVRVRSQSCCFFKEIWEKYSELCFSSVIRWWRRQHGAGKYV